MFTMISFPSPRLKKRRGKHSDGRQSTCYVCGNTPTADKVPDAVGWSTLTGDRVLATFAEILRRPTEYAMLQDGVLQQPTEYEMLQDGVLQRPTEYPMLQDGVLSQPSEY